MELLTNQRGQIRTYLLGYSEPGEVKSVEERLLTDESFLLEFCIEKDELVDDYVNGALSDVDTRQFEEHFLSTPRRTLKLSLARALAARAGSTIQEVPGTVHAHSAGLEPAAIPAIPATVRWQRYWPVAAGLAIMLLAGFVVWKTLQDRSRQSSAEDQQLLQLESEVARLNNSSSELPPESLASLTLKPVSVRGPGEDRRVFVKEDRAIVLLQLELAGDVYETYSASFQTDEGVVLATIPNVQPALEGKGRIVRLKLPGKQLRGRWYQIKLSGIRSSGSYEDVGLYPFQVVKN